jgi:hypothetical protein
MPKPSDSEDVLTMLEGKIDQAKNNGLPPEHMPAIRELLKDFSDIWSLSLTAGPLEKLPPLVIDLKADAIPVLVRLRRYSQEQKEFLSRFVAQLEACSMIYRNPRAAWCAAPLLVPKQGTAQFRFTVDLRPVNKQTAPISWPMPHVESELSRLHGSKYFAMFDLSHGYWQLPHPESRRSASLLSSLRVFTRQHGFFAEPRTLWRICSPCYKEYFDRWRRNSSLG